MYKHLDDSTHITAHDCIAERIFMDGADLVMEFPDGIWIGAKHPHNPYGKTILTDAACIRFTNVAPHQWDCCSLLLVGRQRFGRSLARTLWGNDHILAYLQKKRATVEVLDIYGDTGLLLLRGIVRLSRRKHPNCFWEIEADSVTYCWNTLRPDREW